MILKGILRISRCNNKKFERKKIIYNPIYNLYINYIKTTKKDPKIKQIITKCLFINEFSLSYNFN